MQRSDNLRLLSSVDATKLNAGEGHYRAYVGPPAQYDFMGATQFRLLCALGLREHHSVLDFGCGSLRAGRLLIPYLRSNQYHGLDPNRWLIDDAIDREIGNDLVALKQPVFRYDSDFIADNFQRKFDFIIAQSIFSHAGPDLIATALESFQRVLNFGGLALVTFVQPQQLGIEDEFSGEGWVYPGCVTYRTETFESFAKDAGLIGRLLPWYHPRQSWFALAQRQEDLPPREQDHYLAGAVLRDPEFAASVSRTQV